ncbi:MAG: CxxxxCH/CxxCH domain-containing protein [Pseudomonadota bacterium]
MKARPAPHRLPCVVAIALAASFVACDRTPLVSGARTGDAPECMVCHGGDDNAAPPRDLSGSDDTSQITVGAHQAHLRDGAIRKAVGCPSCHVVPTTTADPGHLGEGPAEVVFDVFAHGEGLNPSWDRVTGRCNATYCHGGELEGGLHSAPLWTQVDGKQVTCKGCHGAPPPEPHPQYSNCWLCHPDTVHDDGTIKVADDKHLDGEVQALKECWDCHGTEDNQGAPPASVDGSTDRSVVGVGAHTAHVQGNVYSAGVSCADCHRVPTLLGDPGHLGSELPAEITFGAVASADGAHPTWNGETSPPTCSNVYCHGSTLEGGTNLNPSWTQAEALGLECDACHGNPPPAPHPQNTACEVCHPGTAADRDHVIASSGLHVNGVVDVPTACNGCHGDATSAAPPRGVDGASSTTQHGVGAHRAHVEDSPIRQALACEACHVVPLSVNSPGHLDDSPAEVVFGALARSDGASPEWNGSADPPTCSAVYCHGASLAGGVATSPTWTHVDGSQAACDSCHGNPPPAPHPQVLSCEICHPRTAGPGPVIRIENGTHIDGEITFF